MKKIFAVLLAVMMLFAFVACENDTPTVDDGKPENAVVYVTFENNDWEGIIVDPDAEETSSFTVADGVLSFTAGGAYFGYSDVDPKLLPTAEKSYEMSYQLTVTAPEDGKTTSLKFSNPLGSGGVGEYLTLTLADGKISAKATEANKVDAMAVELGNEFTIEGDSVVVDVTVLYEFVSEGQYKVSLSVAYDGEEACAPVTATGGAADTNTVSWSFYGGADGAGEMATATLNSFVVLENAVAEA